MAARGLVNGRGPRSGRDLVFRCYPPELLLTTHKKTEADFGSASLLLLYLFERFDYLRDKRMSDYIFIAEEYGLDALDVFCQFNSLEKS